MGAEDRKARPLTHRGNTFVSLSAPVMRNSQQTHLVKSVSISLRWRRFKHARRETGEDRTKESKGDGFSGSLWSLHLERISFHMEVKILFGKLQGLLLLNSD